MIKDRRDLAEALGSDNKGVHHRQAARELHKRATYGRSD
jgi:hypothetical protein